MRPEILFKLFSPAITVPGIGPRIAKLIAKLVGGDRVVDLIWHLPVGLIDRRFAPTVAEAPAGAIATMTLRVERHRPPPNPRLPYKVICADPTGRLELVFFHANRDYLERVLPVGETRVISGRVEHYGGRTQMTHPDHIGTVEDLGRLKAVEPVYRLTGGLSPKTLNKAIAGALERAPEPPEWLDPAYRRQQGWPAWRDALLTAHAPRAEADLSPETPARLRLAYDELLANQLALALVRARLRRLPGRSVRGDGRLVRRVCDALPFALTRSQERALGEFTADMAAEARMLRLLQGDVGSGKTVVAMLTMLSAVEAGAQAALMAPTEILARQHAATLQPLAEAAGVRLGLLAGRDKGRTRERTLAEIASGAIDIVVGTHALFQKAVAFHDLAVAVIDEQHRFGVHQRLDLAGKGRGVDVLVMTATPIPRTLTLTTYGDMEVSRLTEKPAGRQPVDTRTLPLGRLDEVVTAVDRALQRGAKAYWVCPLVEDSEAVDLAAATERYEALAQRFGPAAVGLVHGRMNSGRKDAVMAGFADGPVKLLVATTVIEVGVHVPAATVMVIEHAERFGLAQLHQLRGRIGRGQGRSTCLLMYATPLGEPARTRLKILRQTDDGFRIAEEDLRLRGAGELLGTRQSGLPVFRIAELALHGELLAAARDDARLVLHKDPALKSPRGAALRVLLYLFERDAAVPLLRSG
ncbi:MAG: ATP-dependent DNA helicase RecG [Kiloniellales bacterium]